VSLSQTRLRLVAALEGRSRRCDCLHPGDLWGMSNGAGHYVLLVLGHKRNARRGVEHTFVWLYIMDDASLCANPSSLRDCDSNCTTAEQMLRPEGWDAPPRYLGNLFEMLPLDAMRGEGESSCSKDSDCS
jgi:hypothetical protein